MTSLRIDYGKAAPEAVKALYAVNGFLDECDIPQNLRRLVELRVSLINGCAYCIWLHTGQARALGVAEAHIAALRDWRGAACFSDDERAVLEWVEAVTNITGGTPPDTAFASIKEFFSDRQIVELTVAAANMNALNRVAIGFRLEPPDGN